MSNASQLSDLNIQIKGSIDLFSSIHKSNLKLNIKNNSLDNIAVHKTLKIRFPSFSDFLTLFDDEIIFYFDSNLTSKVVASTNLVLFIDIYDDNDQLDPKRQKVQIFLSNNKHHFSIPIKGLSSESTLEVSFYHDKNTKIDYSICNVGIICQAGFFSWKGHAWEHTSSRINRSWIQKGSKCIFKTNFGNFTAHMPEGWRLDSLSDKHLEIAEFFYYLKLKKILNIYKIFLAKKSI